MTVSFRSVSFRRKSDHTTIVTIGSKTRTCRSASCFYKCQNQVGTRLGVPNPFIISWMKKFIRGSSYIVSDTKRYASKADGNLVPLQSLDHLTTTLTAKWCYSFLVNGHLKKYAKAWLWELSALAKDLGFECEH